VKKLLLSLYIIGHGDCYTFKVGIDPDMCQLIICSFLCALVILLLLRGRLGTCTTMLHLVSGWDGWIDE
jgi:hypothetical protein